MNSIIEHVRNTGRGAYLPNNGEAVFNSLSEAGKWVEGQGYTVSKLGDGRGNGWVHTACGMRISTNGYVCLELPK